MFEFCLWMVLGRFKLKVHCIDKRGYNIEHLEILNLEIRLKVKGEYICEIRTKAFSIAMAAPAACVDPRIKGCQPFYFILQNGNGFGRDGTQESLCGLSGNSRVKLPPQTKPSSQPPTVKTFAVLWALQMVPMVFPRNSGMVLADFIIP